MKFLIINFLKTNSAQPTVEIETTANNDSNSTSQRANQYSEFQINCQYKSQSSVNVSIFFNGNKQVNKTSSQSSNLIMIIPHFDIENVGTYKCFVQSSSGEASAETEIGIRLAPFVSVNPKLLNTVHSRKPIIHCQVTGAEDEYTLIWKSSHRVLKTITNINNAHFTDSISIDNPKVHHKQNITCEIHDKLFRVFDETQVFVEFPPMFTTGVSENLYTKRIFDIGKSYELGCITSENPPATSVEWFFYEHNGVMSKKLLNITEKVYKLDVFNDNMRGSYLCVIKNYLGTATKTFEILSRPKSPPQIIAENFIVAKSGDTANLMCTCKDCLPIELSSVFWMKRSKFIKENLWENEEDSLFDEFKTVLKLKNLTINDSGYYQCNMANRLKKSSTFIELEVHAAPVSISLRVQGKSSGTKKKIKSFVDVTIFCSSDGSPEPEITFYKNDEQIRKGVSSITIQKENIPVASGLYRCVASNYLGKVEKNIKLNYEIPPKFDNEADVIIAKDEGRPIILDCRADGYPSPTIFWFQNERLIEIFGNNKTVKILLSKSSEGKYACEASNGIGKSIIKRFTVGIKRK